MDYVAKKLDLTAKITTLTDEVVILKPNIIINGTNCVRIAKEWTMLEENNKPSTTKEKRGPKTGLEINAIQLSTVYDKTPLWFMDNLDPATIRTILTNVGETVAGAQKN